MYLQHLEYLLAVAEDLHFRKAAERLLISQSALSYHVKQLESEVGAALLQRDKRGVQLTPAGAAFVEHSRHVMDEMDLAVREARRTAHAGPVPLRIGANDGLFGTVVPKLIAQCDLQQPGLRLIWECYSPSAAVHAVQTNDLDAAITTTVGLELPANLSTELLFSSSLRVAVPSGHTHADLLRVPLRAIASEAVLSLEDATGGVTESYVKEIFRSVGVEIGVLGTAARTQALLALVAAGKGLALVPSLARHVHCDGVEYKKLDRSLVQIPYKMVWKMNRDFKGLSAFRTTATGPFRKDRASPTPATRSKSMLE